MIHFDRPYSYYQGKVRDVYSFTETNELAIIVTDRVSAFDHILPVPIPSKGIILNTIAANFLNQVKHICPIWLKEVVHPRVSLGIKCEPIKLEIVVRGSLCGHILREYNKGVRNICGNTLAENLIPYQLFEKPIITPTTKANEGHDMDISPASILENKIVSKEFYEKLESYAYQLFNFGQEYAATRGLILADTKYEFGIYNDEIVLIDEIHTPDSSRYFYSKNYNELVDNHITPKQLSKEFVREWLIDKDFIGRENDVMPNISVDDVKSFRDRYLEIYNLLIDQPLELDVKDEEDSWKNAIESYLEK